MGMRSFQNMIDFSNSSDPLLKRTVELSESLTSREARLKRLETAQDTSGTQTARTGTVWDWERSLGRIGKKITKVQGEVDTLKATLAAYNTMDHLLKTFREASKSVLQEQLNGLSKEETDKKIVQLVTQLGQNIEKIFSSDNIKLTARDREAIVAAFEIEQRVLERSQLETNINIIAKEVRKNGLTSALQTKLEECKKDLSVIEKQVAGGDKQIKRMQELITRIETLGAAIEQKGKSEAKIDRNQESKINPSSPKR